MINLAFSTLKKLLKSREAQINCWGPVYLRAVISLQSRITQTQIGLLFCKTDASDVGVGAVLSQGDDRPFTYLSWMLLD